MKKIILMNDIFNTINLSDLDKYKNSNVYLENEKYIMNYNEYLQNPNNLVNERIYLNFMFNTEYSKEYISKLIYMKYLESCVIDESYINLTYDNKYISKIRSTYTNTFYKLPDTDNKFKEIIHYFETSNTTFASYLKSIQCLLWIMKFYKNILIDSKFNRCNNEVLTKLLTNELKQKIKDDISNLSNKEDYENEDNTELENIIEFLIDNYNKRAEYTKLYNKSFYTDDWNFVDLAKIIEYIDSNSLDVYSILNNLYADYSHAMYNIKPAQPGIQSISIMILESLGYNFDKEIIRTPELQKMVDDIYIISINDYKEDFDKSAKTLTNLFKKTVEKHLTWGLKIF